MPGEEKRGSIRRNGGARSFYGMVGYSHAVPRHPWLGDALGSREAFGGAGMDWLARLHAGERAVIEEVYRGFVDTVDRAVGGVLQGADRETVVHEVFLRLMTDPDLRRAFHGGDIGAWLTVISRNHAIDYARRRNRETPAGLDIAAAASAVPHDGVACRAEARLLLDRFWTELLPVKWRAVFEARFVRSLSQTEAAAALKVHRTTLMYQELRIRQLLRAFLREEGT